MEASTLAESRAATMEVLMLEVAKTSGLDRLRSHQLKLAEDASLMEDFQRIGSDKGRAAKSCVNILLQWYPGAGKTVALVTLVLDALRNVDTFFVTCPNVAPRRQTWQLLCDMLNTARHVGRCMKIYVGVAKDKSRPILRKLDRVGNVVERKLSLWDFHGKDHLQYFCLDAAKLDIVYKDSIEHCDINVDVVWSKIVSCGTYNCSSVSECLELLAIAQLYRVKSVVSVSLAKGDFFAGSAQELSCLRAKTWLPALATDEFHYGAASGGCFNNLEKSVRPVLHIVASASPPQGFRAKHNFKKTLEEGIREGVVPAFKDVYFDMGDFPHSLLKAARQTPSPSLPEVECLQDITRDCEANFFQARSIFVVHCALLLALTIKEFVRSASVDLSTKVSISTSFLTFCGRKWHAQLAGLCMAMFRDNVEWALEIVKHLLENLRFNDRDLNDIPLDVHFNVDDVLLNEFLPWLRHKILTMQIFNVATANEADEVASAVEDTSVLTFVFNCKTLLQGWNAVMLSHVTFLYWEESDPYLLQAKGRALRQAQGKTEPWCLFITDQNQRYQLRRLELGQMADKANMLLDDEATEVCKREPEERTEKARKRLKSTRELVHAGVRRVLSRGPAEDDIWSDDELSFSLDSELFRCAWELPKPPWGSGFGHQLVIFGSRIFVLGGKNNDGYLRDMWYSEDGGVSWRRYAEIPWNQCKGHAAVCTETRLLVIGGCNSEGGYSNNVLAVSEDDTVNNYPLRCAGRHGHQVVVCRSYLILFGGGHRSAVSGITSALNDVWCSEDGGETWQELQNGPWAARFDHRACVCGDRIIMTAGRDAKGNIFADVWVSDDCGMSWSELSPPPWCGRAGHEVVAVASDALILCGGLMDKHFLEDAWVSKDSGHSWTRMADPPWAPRAYHQMLVSDNCLIMLGGLKRNAGGKLGTGLVCDDAWLVPLV